MFVLVHKERVLVGPRDWNRPMFDGALKKLKIDVMLPRRDPQEVPFIIDEDTYITKSVTVIPPHNEVFETYHGPYWNFENPQQAVGTFAIKTREIPQIREIMIRQAADERYRKEVSGTKMTIQDIEVSLDTSRDGRNIFLQKYSLMQDTDIVNWKFPEGWLTLTKEELGLVVFTGAQHIQSAFDWEMSKVDEINSADTVEALEAIVIVEKQEEEVEQFLQE